MERAIIFGAADCGLKAYDYLNCRYEIIAFCDNNCELWGSKLFGVEIISPDDIDNDDILVIVALFERYREVLKQLKEKGHSRVALFSLYGVVSEREQEYRIQLLNWKNICFFDDFPKKKKKILLCANLFPPMGSGGVQRPAKFVKYLKRMGYEPVVLTQNYVKDFNAYDETLLEELADVEIVRVDNHPRIIEELSVSEFEILKELYRMVGCSKVWQASFQDKYNECKCKLMPDNDVLWVVSCLKELNRSISLADIDVVITTAGPYSSFLFGYWTKRKYGIPWIMDFRDSWCESYTAVKVLYPFRLSTYELELEIEKNIIKYADHILTVSEKNKEYLEKIVDCYCITCLKNGFDEDDFEQVEYNKDNNMRTFTILFNGQIYMERNPVVLLDCVNELIDASLIEAETITYSFNGLVDSKTREKLLSSDRYGIIRFNGYKSHIESLNSAVNSSLLILFERQDEMAYHFYSGKIFEYLRLGNPILSFSAPYGVQNDLLKETGLGIAVTYEDKEKVKAFVLNLYNRWKNGEALHKDMSGKLKKYSREYQTLQLCEIIDSL